MVKRMTVCGKAVGDTALWGVGMLARAVRGMSLVAIGGLVLASGVIATIPASAAPETTTIDGVVYTAEDTDVAAGAHVTGFTGSATAVDIPDEVNISGTDYEVVAIEDEVFKSKFLTSVVIGDNVTEIGTMAFGQNAITSLSLGNSVETIGEDAFQNNQLTELVLPNSAVNIGKHAFTYNDLTDLTLPSAIDTISYGAFSNNALEEISLPPTVTMIDDYAFAGNELLDLVLPNSVITIDPYAFENNRLASVTLSDSLTKIGFGSFIDNELTSVTVPAAVTDIRAHAFDRNPGLVSVLFAGEAPVSVSPATATGPSFDTSSGSLVLTYAWRFGDPQVAGGFTSPLWKDYDTQAIATVDFDLNGQAGTAPVDEDVLAGEIATEPDEPAAQGFEFTGWFTDDQGTDEFGFATPITSDLTLFAGWEERGFFSVTKTVEATLVSVYEWDLNKTAAVGAVTVGDDTASAEVDYTVTATPLGVHGDYHVLTGTITVTNEIMEPMDFTVTDDPNIGIDASCDITLDGEPAEGMRAGAQESITFDYACYFDGIPKDGTNTATVTWEAGGEEQTSVTEDVIFTERDSSFKMVTIVDDQTMPDAEWTELGDADWNADGTPVTFDYMLAHDKLTIGECATSTNTAMISQTEQTATADVEICPEAPPTDLPEETTPEDTTSEDSTTGDSEQLPQTGVDVKWSAGAVLFFILAGGTAMMANRRRSQRS